MRLKIGKYPLNVPGAIGYYVGIFAPGFLPKRWYYLLGENVPATKCQIERLQTIAKECRSKAEPEKWGETRREARQLLKQLKATGLSTVKRYLLDGRQNAYNWAERVSNCDRGKWVEAVRGIIGK